MPVCPICESNARGKLSWGPGPWQQEPNYLNWTYLDLACFIHRNGEHAGNLNGYVGLPPDHPLAAVDLQYRAGISVHGGITYQGHALCYRCPEGLVWVGFDCAHCDDYCPAREAMLRRIRTGTVLGLLQRERYQGTYRDLAFVKEETEDLARQLWRLLPPWRTPLVNGLVLGKAPLAVIADALEESGYNCQDVLCALRNEEDWLRQDLEQV